LQGLFQTPREQGSRDIGPHLNTRTHFTEDLGTLDHVWLRTLLRTSQSGRHATDTAAHNEY
jgi:hypothetical protein